MHLPKENSAQPEPQPALVSFYLHSAKKMGEFWSLRFRDPESHGVGVVLRGKPRKPGATQGEIPINLVSVSLSPFSLFFSPLGPRKGTPANRRYMLIS